MLALPMTSLPMSNDNQMKYSDISTSSVKSQTTWSGVVELTGSYTINISDELVIAPCTLVKLPNTARIFVEGRLSIEGDLTCPVIIDQDGTGLHYGIQFNQSSFGRGSIIDNLSIDNSMYGVTIYGSNPVLNNITITNPSRVGIDLFSGANPIISDLIVDQSEEDSLTVIGGME